RQYLVALNYEELLRPLKRVAIGEYDQVLYVRECWLVTGSEKRTETMLDSRDRPFGLVARIVRCLMSRAISGFYIPWCSPILWHMDNGLFVSSLFFYGRHC